MEKTMRDLELDDACIVSTGIYIEINRNSNKFQHAEDVIHNPWNPDSKPGDSRWILHWNLMELDDLILVSIVPQIGKCTCIMGGRMQFAPTNVIIIGRSWKCSLWGKDAKHRVSTYNHQI